MPLPLEYLNPEERKLVENGHKIPTLKRNLDRFVLSRVAEVSFEDMLSVAMQQPRDSALMLGGFIAGKDYNVDTLEYPLDNFWEAELEFGYDYVHDFKMENRGYINLRAVRVGLSPTQKNQAGDELTDELFIKGLQTYHEFTPINGLWTPYESQEDPLALAGLIADMHRSLPGATLPGQ